MLRSIQVPLYLRRLEFVRLYYTVRSSSDNLSKVQNDEISKHISQRIKIAGPMTIAEYMKVVLTNPNGGYYMHRDMFGEEGDFVTSPELGQLFGEMIAIWFLNEWSKLGSPKHLQIIELGPGRGTLCQDMLRVFQHFRVLDTASVHLLEVSPLLSNLQAKRLCMTSHYDENAVVYRKGTSHQGVPISWYRRFADIPKGFSIVIAHEFFDALPIHKLQKTENGYREVLVDVDPSDETKLRFIIAREETPVVKLFVNSDENRNHLEISPESVALINLISQRIEYDGGIALIADYGHNGESKDSFRAFKKHHLHHPLVDPGSADLTADVDFLCLKKEALKSGGILAYGPVSQRNFLLQMGIKYRLEKLEESCSEEQKKGLLYGFNMMTDTDKMGLRFKFLSLFPATVEKILNKYPPIGFGE
ncbi:protein arginine methyltransferase NDUFAF7, mitochondrial [Agrilus planipennis]|uniref:Protein arginine methyltransferase NDUFAF7 n=1 Tax=Agrilus planipennis TaxID=224129 RepID=A0A1W4WVU7_AGRPL|nr:protein arginine methyltransferase NDUFAF7, mitochondrial [Agrilus planipennis]